MRGEQLQLSEFAVGGSYTRKEMAELGDVTLPVGPRDPHWGNGIVVFDNVTILLVTLEKTHYDYQDNFEGGDFWWQS